MSNNDLYAQCTNMNHPAIQGYAARYAAKRPTRDKPLPMSDNSNYFLHPNDLQTRGNKHRMLDIADNIYHYGDNIYGRLIRTKNTHKGGKIKQSGSFAIEVREYTFPDGNVYRYTAPRYSHTIWD
jgi:hypothetical protein